MDPDKDCVVVCDFVGIRDSDIKGKEVYENSYKVRMLRAYLVIIFKPMHQAYTYCVCFFRERKAWVPKWTV